MHRCPWPLALLVACAACGETEIPDEPVPTADEARAFFGLTDGSCARYRFSIGGIPSFATVEITGPNEISIAGRSVYSRVFRFATGGLPTEWFVEARDGGELRLLRLDDDAGGRRSRRYPNDEAPLLLSLEYGADGAPTVAVGARFEVTTTPETTRGDPAPERHRVIVQRSVDLPIPGGETAAGLELLYEVTVGDESASQTLFGLVPGRGVARIQAPDGRTYQACDWRTCSADGVCEGAASCGELSCN